MCRLKKHAYAELSPGENHASQAKSLRPNTRNSAFPRALIKLRFVIKIFVLSIFEWPFYTGFPVFAVLTEQS